MKRLDDHFLLALAIIGLIVLLLPESKIEAIRHFVTAFIGGVS